MSASSARAPTAKRPMSFLATALTTFARYAPSSYPHTPRAHRLTYVFICSAQSVLAYTTGVVAGSAGTFLIVRTVWQRAQLQGDVADARIAELQRLRGHSEDAPPQVSSLSLS